MTRQEMFNKAVRGLRSQGFERCTRKAPNEYKDEVCVYDDGNGKHCAWGWVDESTWSYKEARDTVDNLANRGVGLAASLPYEDRQWASRLQQCHDKAYDAEGVEHNLRQFAKEFSLVFPED